MEHVFHRPMRELQVLPQDQLILLFANLEHMFDLHLQFCNNMKTIIRKENHVVQKIGHVLLNTVCFYCSHLSLGTLYININIFII